MQRRAIFLGFPLALWLMGAQECSGAGQDISENGRRISDDELCSFRYGRTTPDDIVSKLGASDAAGRIAIAGDVTVLAYTWVKKSEPPEVETTQFTFATWAASKDALLGRVERNGSAGRHMGPSCLGPILIDEASDDTTQRITADQLCGLKCGKTTRDAAISKLGQPARETPMTKSSTTLEYLYASISDLPGDLPDAGTQESWSIPHQRTVLAFDEDGTLKAVTWDGSIVQGQNVPSCLNE